MTVVNAGALVITPRLIDAILLGVLAEAVALAIYRRRTGRGMPVRELVSFLAAGAALLLATRVAVSAAAPRPVPFAAAMAAGLVCHLWHLRQRWEV